MGLNGEDRSATPALPKVAAPPNAFAPEPRKVPAAEQASGSSAGRAKAKAMPASSVVGENIGDLLGRMGLGSDAGESAATHGKPEDASPVKDLMSRLDDAENTVLEKEPRNSPTSTKPWKVQRAPQAAPQAEAEAETEPVISMESLFAGLGDKEPDAKKAPPQEESTVVPSSEFLLGRLEEEDDKKPPAPKKKPIAEEAAIPNPERRHRRPGAFSQANPQTPEVSRSAAELGDERAGAEKAPPHEESAAAPSLGFMLGRSRKLVEEVVAAPRPERRQERAGAFSQIKSQIPDAPPQEESA
eukprot:CAMPEP_0180764108 /NCGR_PEP_ID=MMETSP1038_2-20121128/38280_1 /TAXON_ID=632150 /ORGANISM="Azadinium spinosum, Strain 3D9" /LENGTH=299 /DNA_ID=CAMNT_0022798519 /DNA_START=27 /DNA_END=922 /DNA_ORIENTATION=-